MLRPAGAAVLAAMCLAAPKGEADASCYEAHQEKDYATAVKKCTKPAAKGDAKAQFILGAMYAEGRGGQEDDEQAERWYRLAAEQGLVEAQLKLGVMYESGEGAPQDKGRAAFWYWRAARQHPKAPGGSAGSIQPLAQPPGQRIPKTFTGIAESRLRTLAEQGQARAQYNLGYMYASGMGVPQDDEEAARWYRLAAEQGYARAQDTLGALARDGHASAQYNLGLMHANGRGVPQNDKVAARWYGRAAKQGYAPAQYSLGLMRRDGQGVSKDLVLAHQWCSLAEEQRHEEAAACLRALEDQMSERQIDKAHDRVFKWKPRARR